MKNQRKVPKRKAQKQVFTVKTGKEKVNVMLYIGDKEKHAVTIPVFPAELQMHIDNSPNFELFSDDPQATELFPHKLERNDLSPVFVSKDALDIDLDKDEIAWCKSVDFDKHEFSEQALDAKEQE